MRCKICQTRTKIYLNGLYDNRHGYPGKFKVYKCNNCGFMQTFPQLTSDKLTEIYTIYYPKRDTSIDAIVEGAKNIPKKKEINTKGLSTNCHYQVKRGQKVLDVGCGTCQSLLEIKKLKGEAWGIDPDKNSQKVANKLKLKFHLGTIHDCKFPNNYFDLITASQVLEHEPDPIKFLKDCKNFLKPGGKIILSFPNTDALYFKLWGKNWLHWHIPYHLNHFNNKSLKLMIGKAGYKIESIKTATPNLWTILQIRSWINNPKVGQRDPMWDPGSSKVYKVNNNLMTRSVTQLLPLITDLLFINRLIDFLGQGESFVVTLKF